jgi:hypothetical protein
MERVTVRTYREGNSHPKKFGADYIRSNGERIIIATGLRASAFAKEKASIAVQECEWEPFAVREDGYFDVGQGWIDR